MFQYGTSFLIALSSCGYWITIAYLHIAVGFANSCRIYNRNRADLAHYSDLKD